MQLRQRRSVGSSNSLIGTCWKRSEVQLEKGFGCAARRPPHRKPGRSCSSEPPSQRRRLGQAAAAPSPALRLPPARRGARRRCYAAAAVLRRRCYAATVLRRRSGAYVWCWGRCGGLVEAWIVGVPVGWGAVDHHGSQLNHDETIRTAGRLHGGFYSSQGCHEADGEGDRAVGRRQGGRQLQDICRGASGEKQQPGPTSTAAEEPQVILTVPIRCSGNDCANPFKGVDKGIELCSD